MAWISDACRNGKCLYCPSESQAEKGVYCACACHLTKTQREELK